MPALVPPEVGTATNSHFPSTVGNNPNFCVPCTSSFKLTCNFFSGDNGPPVAAEDRAGHQGGTGHRPARG